MTPCVSILPITCHACGKYLTRFHQNTEDDEIYCLGCAAKATYDAMMHHGSGLTGGIVTPDELSMRRRQLQQAHQMAVDLEDHAELAEIRP